MQQYPNFCLVGVKKVTFILAQVLRVEAKKNSLSTKKLVCCGLSAISQQEKTIFYALFSVYSNIIPNLETNDFKQSFKHIEWLKNY
jgi:hypothetical protein